jgi:hypothetical protein
LGSFVINAVVFQSHADRTKWKTKGANENALWRNRTFTDSAKHWKAQKRTAVFAWTHESAYWGSAPASHNDKQHDKQEQQEPTSDPPK